MTLNQRNRVFVLILLAYTLGLALLMWRLLGDIDPRYRESAEESMVETAYLMAAMVEQQSSDNINVSALAPVFDRLRDLRVKADIFGFEKTRIELRATVVDAQGRVLFDSTGKHLGADFSQWRDVRLSLQGEYGARLTPDVASQPNTAVMYVAAPIRLNGQIAGVVSIGKPTQSFGQFVEAARQKTLLVGITSGLAVLVLLVILSVWLMRPWQFALDFFRFMRAQRKFNLSRLSRRAWGTLGAAYAEMRDVIAGRHYVSDYVQTLTHELKSPLSAIRGAAELLQEPMPDADRKRFLGNIEREAQRIQELVDRMMELAALESRRHLDNPQPVALRPLLAELCSSAFATGAARRIDVQLQDGEDVTVLGDAFLLRRAVGNLLDNALDFAPAGSRIAVSAQARGKFIDVQVQDQGPGIPDYAGDKVFEKFYSLARPQTQRKSTGLGLPFVKEIALLHDGSVTLRNAPEGGALAVLTLYRFAD